MFKKIIVVIAAIAIIVVGIMAFGLASGEVEFSGGMAYIAVDVIGGDGQRVPIRKNFPLTETISYQGIEVSALEYSVSVEFADFDAELLSGSSVEVTVDGTRAGFWAITPTTVPADERTELKVVSIQASELERLATSTEFEVAFTFHLVWKVTKITITDIEYPSITFTVDPENGEDPPDPGDPPPPPTPPICQCIIMSVNFTPNVSEK